MKEIQFISSSHTGKLRSPDTGMSSAGTPINNSPGTVSPEAFNLGPSRLNSAVPLEKGTKSCSCGNCGACAARAYAAQAGTTGQGAAQGVPLSTGDDITGEKVPVQENQSEASPLAPKGSDGQPLSRSEQLMISELKQIDKAVRAHERAHLSAAGPYARGKANFQYEKGPDGGTYAVAGEVRIDTSAEASPKATITKMNVVRAAALAPVDPSPQDRSVASEASSKILQASDELRVLRMKQVQARAQTREKENDDSEDVTPIQSESGQEMTEAQQMLDLVGVTLESSESLNTTPLHSSRSVVYLKPYNSSGFEINIRV
ncbi:MAG: hypothetical protein KKE17_06370 [Proteobacteria bacterium]|nr:hypothetical protein [Pseudomonadota bacterium]MBU1709613.1 hypothetical protein [Pseudomonadota bacterium]